MTVYRNGLVRDLARSSGQEAIYGRLEAAVGGPSFGTPRAVEQLDVAAAPVGTKAAQVAPGAKKDSTRTAERTSAPALRLEDLPPAAAETALAPKVAEGPAARTVSAEKASPQTSPAVKHVSSASAHPSSAPAPAAPRSHNKAASRMYDPLNPNP